MARPIYYQWCQCQLCTYSGVGKSENLGGGDANRSCDGTGFVTNSAQMLWVNCLPAPHSAGPDLHYILIHVLIAQVFNLADSRRTYNRKVLKRLSIRYFRLGLGFVIIAWTHCA